MPVFKVTCYKARQRGAIGVFGPVQVEIAAPDWRAACEEFAIMYERISPIIGAPPERVAAAATADRASEVAKLYVEHGGEGG